jgi:hypothetical protein
MQVRAIALEELVRCHFEENIEIAWRSAPQARLTFAGEPNAGPIFHACRDIHRKSALASHPPSATAHFARIVDNLAAAMTGRAGAFEREEALRMSNSARAATA